MIPQGARLVVVYDSQVSFGQSRLLRVWTRLLLPNGNSIVFERQPGADGSGQTGLQDGVDHHWGSLFKAALFPTILAVGTELGSDQNDSDIVRAMRRAAGDTMNQAGQEVVRGNLNSQPTLTIRPGYPVRVIVRRAISCFSLIADRRKPMSKLKLGAILDEKPAKLTGDLPAAIHRDLAVYAEALGRETVQTNVAHEGGFSAQEIYVCDIS